ncbi:MAG: response regulator, partial [Terriglobales bacterium]
MSTTSESVSAVAPGVGERRIVAAVEDLFFLAKIQETARQLGVHLTVAKTEDQILQLVQGEPAPTLIILDLNGSATKPLAVIAQLRKDPALKKTSLVGFLSHLQADLKVQAQEAGCDLVMPRSAFSQNLPSL